MYTDAANHQSRCLSLCNDHSLIVSRIENNKTWQKYRLCNPRPRYFADQPCRNNPSGSRGKNDKTWQGYRLSNPRLRYFADPIFDPIVHPETSILPETAIAPSNVAHAISSGQISLDSGPAPGSVARPLQDPKTRIRTSFIPLPSSRSAGLICGAATVVGVCAWLMSKPQEHTVLETESLVGDSVCLASRKSVIDNDDTDGKNEALAWRLRFGGERDAEIEPK